MDPKQCSVYLDPPFPEHPLQQSKVNMKYSFSLIALLQLGLSSAIVIPGLEQQHVLGPLSLEKNSELRLVQLSPLETRWVTEEQKLELKRVSNVNSGIVALTL